MQQLTDAPVLSLPTCRCHAVAVCFAGVEHSHNQCMLKGLLVPTWHPLCEAAADREEPLLMSLQSCSDSVNQICTSSAERLTATMCCSTKGSPSCSFHGIQERRGACHTLHRRSLATAASKQMESSHPAAASASTIVAPGPSSIAALRGMNGHKMVAACMLAIAPSWHVRQTSMRRADRQ